METNPNQENAATKEDKTSALGSTTNKISITKKAYEKCKNLYDNAKKTGTKIINPIIKMYDNLSEIRTETHIMWATWILGISAVLGIYFTHRQINILDESMQTENRAFILLSTEGVYANLDYSNGTIIRFKVRFKNTGKTPAFNIRDRGISCAGWGCDLDTSLGKLPWHQIGYLGANEFLPIVGHVNGAIPIKYFLTNDSSAVYFYGEIRYDDFFNKHHITHYYFKVVPTVIQHVVEIDSLIKARGVNDGYFGSKLMETHNEAD